MIIEILMKLQQDIRSQAKSIFDEFLKRIYRIPSEIFKIKLSLLIHSTKNFLLSMEITNSSISELKENSGIQILWSKLRLIDILTSEINKE
jgi:hypothetical protein